MLLVVVIIINVSKKKKKRLFLQNNSIHLEEYGGWSSGTKQVMLDSIIYCKLVG